MCGRISLSCWHIVSSISPLTPAFWLYFLCCQTSTNWRLPTSRFGRATSAECISRKSLGTGCHERVTIKHDGMRNCIEDVRIATGAACTVLDNCVIGQNGTANLLIAALADSGNRSQTKQNVKITFIYCDFLKNQQMLIPIWDTETLLLLLRDTVQISISWRF